MHESFLITNPTIIVYWKIFIDQFQLLDWKGSV